MVRFGLGWGTEGAIRVRVHFGVGFGCYWDWGYISYIALVSESDMQLSTDLISLINLLKPCYYELQQKLIIRISMTCSSTSFEVHDHLCWSVKQTFRNSWCTFVENISGKSIFCISLLRFRQGEPNFSFIPKYVTIC